MNAHNLLHLLRLRLDEHAQWEVREYARAISRIVAEWIPLTWEAFVDYRINGYHLSAQELVAIVDVLGTAQLDEVCAELLNTGSTRREVDALRAAFLEVAQ